MSRDATKGQDSQLPGGEREGASLLDEWAKRMRWEGGD